MEKSGFVWTSLKRPNSGRPNSAKPWFERARRMICSKPIFSRGQPSARANGPHMAITSGVRTIEGFSSAAYGRSASKLSSRPHSDDAGDQITGSSRPSAIFVCASPLDDDLADHERLAILLVELADQRREQLLLLGRVGERQTHGALRRLVRRRAAVPAAVVAPTARDEHGNRRDGDRRNDAMRSCPRFMG